MSKLENGLRPFIPGGQVTKNEIGCDADKMFKSYFIIKIM